MNPEILIALVSAVFGAGGFAALIRVLGKDVNGLGGKLGRMQADVSRDKFRSAVIILAACPEEHRRWIAEQLLKD